MLFPEKRHEIVEKDSSLVSYSWKVYHILSLLGALSCSFVASYSFQLLITSLGDHCFLNARLKFKNQSLCYTAVGEFELNESFHNSETIWGDYFSCQYFEFVYLFSFIVGLVLICFIVLLPRGGVIITHDTYTRPWKVVFPALVIAFLSVVFILTAYVMLKSGISSFCMQFEEQLDSKKCTKDINVYSLLFNQHYVDIHKYMVIVNASSNMALICWIMLFVSFMLRLIRGADFKVVVYHWEKADRSSKTMDLEIDTDSTVTELEMDEKGKYITAESSIQSSFHSPVNV